MKQNDIKDLPELGNNRYENIFNVFTTQKGDNIYYYYNIFNRISIPRDTADNVFDKYKITRTYPWTTLSERIYGTQFLWWLLVAANNIQNPVQLPAPGSILKAVKPEYVQIILSNIK